MASTLTAASKNAYIYSNLRAFEVDVKLVNPEHIENLESLIDREISVVYLPDLVMRPFPDSQIDGIESYSHIFYESNPVNIKVSNGKEYFWVIIQAEDSNRDFRTRADKSSSPNLECLYGEIGYGDGEKLKEQKKDLRPSRLDLWREGEKITKIELHRVGSDTAYLIYHNTGKVWCIYTQFDWGCWVSLDQDICSKIKEQSLEKQLIT